MPHPLDELYMRLPARAQDWALHIKGIQERRIRFGKHYQQFAHDVAARRYWQPAQLANFQLDALNHIVTSAARHVPFYRRLYTRTNGRAARIDSLADLAELPIIDKATLRHRNADFRDRRLRARDMISIKTTGTTGTPVTVFTTARARQLNYAYYNDFLSTVDLNPFGKRIVLGGRMIMSGRDRRAPYWRFSRSMNTIYMSSYHISPATAPAYARAWNDWNAEYVDGYPSSLSILAESLRDRGLTVRPPRAVITSSESLYPEQRAIIEEVFGAKVYDQYGAREMCMFAAQCRWGRYHVRPDYGLLEIHKDGRAAKPGEIGSVLCTGFVNPAMPLIRYEIGDMAAWALDQECDCGSAGPIIEEIVGRQDDALVCANGRRIGRLSPLVLRDFPVREAQYVQRELGVVIVRLVRGQGYTDRDTDAIRAKLGHIVGDDMSLEFEFVEAIPRGAGGKFRAVISEINGASRSPGL